VLGPPHRKRCRNRFERGDSRHTGQLLPYTLPNAAASPQRDSAVYAFAQVGKALTGARYRHGLTARQRDDIGMMRRAACTLSQAGVCEPKEMQCAPSTVRHTSGMSNPSVCSSPGSVVSEMRGPGLAARPS
jgi:hypothetical protein